MVLLLTGGYMGLRWSELRGLQRKRFTLNGEPAIEEQVIEPRGHLKLAKLHTDKARRRLPVPDFLHALLLKQIDLRDCGPDDYILVDVTVRRSATTGSRGIFRKAVRAAGSLSTLVRQTQRPARARP